MDHQPGYSADGVKLKAGMTVYVLNSLLGQPFTAHEVAYVFAKVITYRDAAPHTYYGAKLSRVFVSKEKAEEARIAESQE